MYRTVFLSIFMLILSPALAYAQASEVTADDLAAAGYTQIRPVPEAGGRFKAPVLYFRVAQTISVTLKSKDCADCGNLVGVFVGTSTTVPSWGLRGGTNVRTIAARSQARIYDRGAKRVIIVTGPDEKTVVKLAEILDKKFSGR